MSWTSRVRLPAGSPPLHQVKDAAENLANQAGIPPGKMRVVFQTVGDVALVGTVVVSGALAAVHLYRTLFPQQKADHPGPKPAGSDHSPPRRRGPHATAAAAAGDEGYEHEGFRSR